MNVAAVSASENKDKHSFKVHLGPVGQHVGLRPPASPADRSQCPAALDHDRGIKL